MKTYAYVEYMKKHFDPLIMFDEKFICIFFHEKIPNIVFWKCWTFFGYSDMYTHICIYKLNTQTPIIDSLWNHPFQYIVHVHVVK